MQDLVVGDVPDHHVHQVVELAGHEVAAHHLGPDGHGCLERVERGLGLADEGDPHEHVGAEAYGGRIQEGHVAVDVAAVLQAAAGADIIAPSDMMDGRIAAIRDGLDDQGHENVALLAYAVKYASAYYGPFRDAADSSPQHGDRQSYQMDGRNMLEALREADLDEAEGADMLMVKPALAYLDVIQAVRGTTTLPLSAYNVSGEYAAVKAAAERGWLDEARVVRENLYAIRRAGADQIITYHARDALQGRWL